MLNCRICGNDYSDIGLQAGRCPHCGNVVVWEDAASMEEAKQAIEMPPPNPEVNMTIQPRDLSPEQMDGLSKMWRGTYTEASTPSMTLSKDTSNPGAKTNLVIQTRSLRQNDDSKYRRADYEIENVIGEGGVGVVYEARQASIDRTVALKMLREEISEELDYRDKFLSEAVVTGELDHPNIVPIYDLGVDRTGKLFYSMKRVSGTPWLDVINDKSQAENISILMKVCDAVAFAHSRGVIHRDLKPENVMLGDFGEVLVMDWGIAMSTDVFTKSGNVSQSISMGGTPAYMAPEMATGPISRIRETSDVYLLGAILYESITNRPPHIGRTVEECLNAAARNQIVPTEETGELLEVAYQAMSTRPENRYQSVKEFQDAIRQYQSHSESILLSIRAEEDLTEARQANDYQIFAGAVFGFQEAIGLWSDNERASEGLIEAKLAYAQTAHQKGDYDLGLSLLDADLPQWKSLRKELRQAQKERDVRVQRFKHIRRTLVGLVAIVFFIVVSFTMVLMEKRATLERQSNDLAAKNSELSTTQDSLQESLLKQQTAQTQLSSRNEALKAEKTNLVNARQELRNSYTQLQESVVAARRASRQTLRAQDRERYLFYFSQINDASRYLNSNEYSRALEVLDRYNKPGVRHLRHWEWARFMHYQRLNVQTFTGTAPVTAVTTSPDGRWLVTGRLGGNVYIWDLAGQQPYRTLALGGERIEDLDISPDGQTLLIVSRDPDQPVKLVNLAQGVLLSELSSEGRHNKLVTSACFVQQGRRILTSSRDGTAKLWELESGRVVRTFRGHHAPVLDADMSPDGSTVATASEDGSVVVWSRPQGQEWSLAQEGSTDLLRRFSGHRGAVYRVCFSPDGARVATAGRDGRILMWHPDNLSAYPYKKKLDALFADSSQSQGTAKESVEPMELQGRHRSGVRGLAFSADGLRLVSGGNDNRVIVWNVLTAKPIKVMRGHSKAINACAFVPLLTGTWVVSGSQDGDVKLWHTESYNEFVSTGQATHAHQAPILSAGFNRDGTMFATASQDRSSRVYRLRGNLPPELVYVLKEGHEFLVSSAVFHPKNLLFSTALDSTVRIWDVASGAQRIVLRHTGHEASLALSQDGDILATGSENKQALLWFVPELTSQERADGYHPISVSSPDQGVVTAVAIHGNQLFTADENGRCMMWQIQRSGNKLSVKLRWETKHHSGPVHSATFLGDTGNVLTASQDGKVKRINIDDGTITAELEHPAIVVSLSVSHNGSRVLTSCQDGQIRWWDIPHNKVLRTLHMIDGGPACIAGNVRRRMTQRRWKEETLGTRSGVQPVDIGRILRGEDVAEAHLEKIATALESTIDELRQPLATDVSVSRDGKYAASASAEEGAVRVWNLETGRQVPRTPSQDQPVSWDPTRVKGVVWSAAFAPDGQRLLVLGGRQIRLLALQSMPGKRIVTFSSHEAVSFACFNPAGSEVATASWDGSVKIWDMQSGQVRHKLAGGHRAPIYAIAYAPDGKYVYTGDADGVIRKWLVATGQLLEKPVYSQTAAIHRIVYNPIGQLILAGADGKVRIVDAANGQIVRTLDGHTGPILALDITTDGRFLATGGVDQKVRIWDAESGRLLRTVEGHGAQVNSVNFSPDGLRLATASDDGTVKLWDTRLWDAVQSAAGKQENAELKEVLTLGGHTDEVTCVQFTRDGRTLLSAGRAGMTIIWHSRRIEPSIHATAFKPSYPPNGNSGDRTPMLIDPEIVLRAPNTVDFDQFTLEVQIMQGKAGETLNLVDGIADRITLDFADALIRSTAVSGGEMLPIGRWTLSPDGRRLTMTFGPQAHRGTVQAVCRRISYAGNQAVANGQQRTIRYQLRHNAKVVTSTQKIIELTTTAN